MPANSNQFLFDNFVELFVKENNQRKFCFQQQKKICFSSIWIDAWNLVWYAAAN